MDEDRKATNPRAYGNLMLELRAFNPDNERYQVALSGDSVGELEPATARLAYSEIEEALLELEDGGIEEEDDLITFGRALADRLLPEGDVRTQVTEAIRSADRDRGVRLRLLIRQPRLAELPWEYAYLSLLGRESPSDFLVLNPVVSLVRHEPLPLQHASVAPRDPDRLRMVAATANAPGYLELDLRKERQILEKVLGVLPSDGASIEYEPILVDPSQSDLQAALVRGADVFHFAGHGGLRDGKGFVALPSEEGTEAVLMAADKLANLLQGAGVRIAVLGACESGRRDPLSRWVGIAPALVAGVPGVPAVVAMQYRVRDSVAIKFAQAFYTSVAAGLSVDEAVYQGRLALLDPDDLSASWAIPVLYLRSVDGVVFPHLTDRPSSTADALRDTVNVLVRVVKEGGEVTGLDAADADSLRVLAALKAGAVNVKADEVFGKVIGIKVGGGHKNVDDALREARLRYARGEITHEQFMQLIRDLA
jgi:CHAT domain